jgi:hypothetical protein
MPEKTPTKEDLLAAIASERRFWDALVAAVECAGVMDRPGANNAEWTFKDMAAHLNAWRGRTIARLEAAHQGTGPPPHPWPAGWDEGPNTDAINAWFMEQYQGWSAADVLAESAAQFDALDAVVRAMPDDDLLMPDRFAWFHNLPIGPASLGYSFTHLHTDHEPDILAWLRRETGSEPTLPPAPTTFGYVE